MILILLVCSLLLVGDGTASHFRAGPKNDKVQVEDYIIMQMEMAWGMKEMSRYKSHRGGWPTRSVSNFDDDDEVGEETQQYTTSLVRGRQDKEEVNQKEEEPRQVNDPSLRGKQREGEREDSNSTSPSPAVGEIDNDLAVLLRAGNAAKTVEEYWDALVAMF